MTNDILNNVVDIIEAICSVGNLGLLIYFTNREWKYSHEKDKVEIQMRWYETIIIDRTIDLLIRYFNAVDNDLSNASLKKLDKIEKVNSELNHHKRIIIPCLEIFSHSFQVKVFKLIQEHNDIALEEAERDRTTLSISFERDSNKKKAEIFKVIHEFDCTNI